MITIKKSLTADTRSCDPSAVTKVQLLESSIQHIGDVGKALAFFSAKLTEAASLHDYDKLSNIDWFHEDFQTNILKPDGWLENHYRLHRHHLDKSLGCPRNVNLIDVIEHVADCVMAGLGRSGNVYPITLTNQQLQDAVVNTVELLKNNVAILDQQAAEAE